MSMNLAFEVKGGGFVDFPFQTPTTLSFAVMDEKNEKKRLKLIEDQMKKWNWDKETIKGKMREIKTLMTNKNLELFVI